MANRVLTSDQLNPPPVPPSPHAKPSSVWDQGESSDALQLRMLERAFAAGKLNDKPDLLRRRSVLRGEIKPGSYEEFAADPLASQLR